MEAAGAQSLRDWAERVLGHRFAQPALLEEALTHASAGPPDYERLEFLGDRVLGCVVAAWAVAGTHDDAGGLNRRQAALVDRATCAEVARELGLAERLRMDRAALNAQVQHSDGYPGWKPNMDSPILKLATSTYRSLYGKDPEVKAVHAGLECGIIGERIPGMDMISFGPTLEAVHSPEERIHIDTVERFWNLLLEILKRAA